MKGKSELSSVDSRWLHYHFWTISLAPVRVKTQPSSFPTKSLNVTDRYTRP